MVTLQVMCLVKWPAGQRLRLAWILFITVSAGVDLERQAFIPHACGREQKTRIHIRRITRMPPSKIYPGGNNQIRGEKERVRMSLHSCTAVPPCP